MKKIYIWILAILQILTEVTSAQELKLTIKQFANLLNSSPNAQILDARSPEEFAVNHIKGAININLKDIEGSDKIISSLNPQLPTFSYSINNGRSAALVKKLRESGFEKVYELPGGLGNWVGAGYPLLSFNNKGLTISTENFKKIIDSKKLVLVDFGSKFCGGCRKLIPVLDSLENNFGANLKIVRVEFDDNPQLVKDQHIQALPTLKLFINGEQIWENKGFISYKEMSTVVQSKENLFAITK